MVNLVWLPIQQYQEDGRIVWGLQRGASSFTTSTGVAFVELSGRLLHTVQVCSAVVLAYSLCSMLLCWQLRLHNYYGQVPNLICVSGNRLQYLPNLRRRDTAHNRSSLTKIQAVALFLH